MAVRQVGLSRAIQRLNNVRARLSNPAPLMRDVSVKLHQNVITRFVREIDPQNSAWPKSIRARTEGGQTLTDTGRLRGSIRFSSGRNYAEVFTNTVVYAAPHNYGLTVGRGVKLPRREFIGYGVQDELAIRALANEYVKY